METRLSEINVITFFGNIINNNKKSIVPPLGGGQEGLQTQSYE
jgi:hypothetical protein